jgi:hypothetical protein
MYKLVLQSSWDGKIPSVAVDHIGPSYEDLSEQAANYIVEPQPNTCIFRATQVDEATMLAINADPNYEIISAKEIQERI